MPAPRATIVRNNSLRLPQHVEGNLGDSRESQIIEVVNETLLARLKWILRVVACCQEAA